MAIDFPASPTLNQTFSSGNVNYVWDGTKWTASVTGGIALDKIQEGNTSAEVVDTGSDGRFVVTTEGSERLRIDSSGRVGIGTTTPQAHLDVRDNVGGSARLDIHSQGSGGQLTTLVAERSGPFRISTESSLGAIAFNTGSAGTTERARIDSSGRLLVGTSSSSLTAKLIIQARTDDSTGNGAVVVQRGSIPSAANQTLGAVQFTDSSGNYGAWILGESDGGGWTSGSNHRSRLVFSTTADGASSPTERMRITQAGAVIIGKTTAADNTAGTYTLANGQTSHTVSGDYPLYINRLTNDGTLIRFDQDTVNEGSISVSGTTVSYNGAHLSRWSQLSGIDPHDKDQRPEILRGTVMSNLDEMCEWGEEDNEQLNRMKVSDIEGDKNVSGVFQAWDDDDDTYTNDFYCAMTGDFIIRINAGVTVERGDLLMSAGDGTAKPQDDDVIRSKTIAKVTSTNVSCTYDDGSYCVPCVLMAC